MTLPPENAAEQSPESFEVSVDELPLSGVRGEDAGIAGLVKQQPEDFEVEEIPAYEPSGEDFVSPCLAEADLMRRVLPGPEFRGWLARFLPHPGDRRFVSLRRPPEVRDPKDPKIGHLIGLSLQRAWSYRGIATALPTGTHRQVFERLAGTHREHAFSLLFDSGYGGAHWLASFATYLLSDAGLKH